MEVKKETIKRSVPLNRGLKYDPQLELSSYLPLEYMKTEATPCHTLTAGTVLFHTTRSEVSLPLCTVVTQ